MKENSSVAQNEKTDNETAYEEQTVFALLLTFALNCWSTTGLTAPQTLDTETHVGWESPIMFLCFIFGCDGRWEQAA